MDNLNFPQPPGAPLKEQTIPIELNPLNNVGIPDAPLASQAPEIMAQVQQELNEKNEQPDNLLGRTAVRLGVAMGAFMAAKAGVVALGISAAMSPFAATAAVIGFSTITGKLASYVESAMFNKPKEMAGQMTSALKGNKPGQMTVDDLKEYLTVKNGQNNMPSFSAVGV